MIQRTILSFLFFCCCCLFARYLHLLYESTKNVMDAPTIHSFQRAEYPFDWIDDLPDTGGCDAIIAACKANLVACVDGGVVDTCWRERAQWTGDARMSGMALRRLTRNPEVCSPPYLLFPPRMSCCLIIRSSSLCWIRLRSLTMRLLDWCKALGL